MFCNDRISPDLKSPILHFFQVSLPTSVSLSKLSIDTGQVPLFPRHAPTKKQISYQGTNHGLNIKGRKKERRRKFQWLLYERAKENNIKATSSFQLVVPFFYFYLSPTATPPRSCIISLLFSSTFSISLPDLRIDQLRFLHSHYKKENKKKIRNKDVLGEPSRKINHARFNRWGRRCPGEPFDHPGGAPHCYCCCDFGDM